MSTPSSSDGLGRKGSRILVIGMGLLIVIVAVATALMVRNLANDPETQNRIDRIKAQQQQAVAPDSLQQPAPDSTR